MERSIIVNPEDRCIIAYLNSDYVRKKCLVSRSSETARAGQNRNRHVVWVVKNNSRRDGGRCMSGIVNELKITQAGSEKNEDYDDYRSRPAQFSLRRSRRCTQFFRNREL